MVEKRTQTNVVCTALSYTGTLQAGLRYDPMGRLFETTGAATTRFLYDGDALLVEYDGTNTALRRYVHGANPGVDDPIAWFSSSSFTAAATRHLFANQQGSLILSGDSAGNALRIFAYDEYGVPTTAGGAAQLTAANGARFGYTGQAWIPELGMYHYKARVYSPTLGRFMQTDPIGYDDQMNLYAYVGNDPVNRSDPTGMTSSVTDAGCRIFGSCTIYGKLDGTDVKTVWLPSSATAGIEQTSGESWESDTAALGWIFKRLPSGALKALARITSEKAAVEARKKGIDVAMDTKQMAKRVARASAPDPNKVVRHKGHTLTDGSKGSPHFQAPGQRGHTFWGTVTAGLIGMIEALDIMDELSNPVYVKELGACDVVIDNPCAR